MDPFARLIIPAIRADDESFWPLAEELAREGFGGFLVFGGERETLPGRIAALRRAAPRPILVCADLERGAGQQVRGLTRLPHLMAIGAAGDEGAAERAGEITAREARSVGIDAVFAPCVDLNTDPANPIINIRALGDDPFEVGRLGAAWARGARRGGALACAKHYPGHGHTSVDSHLALPRLDADRATIERRELVPFRRLVAEGVPLVMTAHMAVPALTGEQDLPVTLSAAAIRALREHLGFRGAVVTDALLMGGITGAFDEAEAAVRALEAGCDILLCPADPRRARDRLRRAVEEGRVMTRRVEEALGRIEALRRALPERPGEPPDPAIGDPRLFAEDLAEKSLAALPGAPPPRSPELLVLLSGDSGEAGGELAAEIARLAPETRILPVGPDSPAARLEIVAAQAQKNAIIALFSKILAWKGAAGLPEREARWLYGLAPRALISLGSPYLLASPKSAGLCTGPLCCAPFRACSFSDEPPSQRAVARALVRGGPWPGRFPVRMPA